MLQIKKLSSQNWLGYPFRYTPLSHTHIHIHLVLFPNTLGNLYYYTRCIFNESPVFNSYALYVYFYTYRIAPCAIISSCRPCRHFSYKCIQTAVSGAWYRYLPSLQPSSVICFTAVVPLQSLQYLYSLQYLQSRVSIVSQCLQSQKFMQS